MDNLSFKLKYPFSLKDVSQTIEKQNHKNICQGGPSSINFPGYYIIIVFIIIYFNHP